MGSELPRSYRPGALTRLRGPVRKAGCRRRRVKGRIEGRTSTKSGIADAHRSCDPPPGKTGSGELRAYITPLLGAMFWPCMPAGEQVVLRVTWNLFYFSHCGHESPIAAEPPILGVVFPQPQGPSSSPIPSPFSTSAANLAGSTCSPSCASHSIASSDPSSARICSNTGTRKARYNAARWPSFSNSSVLRASTTTA